MTFDIIFHQNFKHFYIVPFNMLNAEWFGVTKKTPA